MRTTILAALLVGASLALCAQTMSPPATAAVNPAAVVTREQLEQRLTELKAGKEQAIANVNAFEGAIQETLRWLDELDKASTEKPTAPAPTENNK
jgi:hypothetical protein